MTPRRCVVVGLARSGRAAAAALRARRGPSSRYDANAALDVAGSTATSTSASGTTPSSTASGSSSRAPACPRRRRRWRRHAPAGVPVVSEIELGARMLANPILGITGTNGKTTTTALLGAMFDGRRAFRPRWPATSAGR